MTANARQNPAHRLPDWRITMPLANASPRCGARTRACAPCQGPSDASKASPSPP